MACQYIHKNGACCNKPILADSKFCHLKSHYDDIDIYNKIVNNIKNNFKLSTESKDNFKIIDVAADGACAYRCLGRALYDLVHYDDLKIYFDNVYVDQLKRLLEEGNNMNEHLEKRLSIILQNILREWIYHNKDIKIENIDCTLEDFVLSCHDVDTIDEYYELYKIYSGDDDFIKIDTGNKYKKGKNIGKPIYKKKYIENRWGASPEHFAFSKIFGVKLSIYVLKKFDERSCKIVKGYIKGNNSRLSLWETFNNELSDQTYHVKLLLTDKQSGHYLYLQ